MRPRIFLIMTIVVVKFNLSIFPSVSQEKYNTWLPVETKGVYGGVTRSIVIDPYNSDKIYVGLKGGGIYKTANQSLFWYPILTNFSNYNILSLKIHPDQSNSIYAGTEDGLYKSTNEGMDWEWLYFGGQINDILIDTSSDPDKVYIAVCQLYGDQTQKKGLWWSEDGGKIWSDPVIFSHIKEIVDVFTFEIAFYPPNNRPEPDASKAIYIGTSKGIWISYDGESWPDTMHFNDLWNNPVYALAVHPTKPQYVYAGTNDGVVYSKKFGLPGDPDTWQQDFRSLRGIRISSLAIDDSLIFAGTWGEGIFRNHAQFAEDHNTTWACLTIDAKYIYKIKFDPNNHNILYAATSLGVYQSTDYGLSWNPMNEGISCAKINQIFIPDSNLQSSYFLATELGGFKTDNINNDWRPIPGLPQHELITFFIHPGNSNFQYAGFKDYDKLFISDNGGNSWYQKGLGEICDINNFTPVIAYNVAQPEIYIGSSNGLWHAIGTIANKIATGLGDIISLAIDTTSHIDMIYAGTNTNGLWKVSEDGNIKIKLENGIRGDAVVNCISVEQFGDYNLIVGTDYGLRISKSNSSIFERPTDRLIKSNLIEDFYPSTVDTIPSYASTGNSGNIRSFHLLEDWEELNNGREALADLFKNLVPHPDSQKVLYSTTKGGQIYRMQTEPEIAISPHPLDFSGQRVKRTIEKYITIQNDGEWPLIIYDYTIEPDSLNKFYKIELPDSLVILPRKTTDVPITFCPTDRILYSATAKLASTVFNKEQNFVEIIGFGIAPVIEINPDSLKFNELLVEGAATKSFVMKNTGDDTLNFRIEFFSDSGCYIAKPESGQLLPNNDPLIIDVTFRPLADTTYDDTLKIVDKDNSSFYGENVVYLTGKGFKGKRLDIRPDSLIFEPTRPAKAEIMNFVLANVGNEAFSIDSLIASEPFSVPNTSFYLNPGEIAELEVTFFSNQTGDFKEILQVFSEAKGDSELYLEAHCKTGPICRISPASINYDSVYIQDVSAIDLTIKNVGNSELIIDSTKYDVGLFIRTEPGNPLDKILGTDDSTKLRVYWSPQQPMNLRDSINFATNTTIGNTTVPITGNSVSPVFDWPDTIKFANVLHHTSETVIVEVPYRTNKIEPLIFNVEKSGPDKNVFEIEYNAVVAANQVATTQIVFKPTELGKHLAYLDVSSTTPFFGNSHVVLSGKSIIDPIINIQPARYNFGDVKVREEKSKLFIIANQGEDTLVIKGYWFEPEYGDSIYTVEFTNRIIPPGKKETMIVTFKPDTIRQYPTILYLDTNPALGDASVVLDGEGIIPRADSKPPHISYNWQDVDSLHRGESTTITAYVTDSLSGVNSVDVRFREAGEDSFIREIALIRQIDTTQYTGNIPGDLITMRGLEYYIEATDKAENRATHPEKFYHSARTYVNKDEIESKPDFQPFGSMEISYRMISFPFKFYPDDNAKQIMQFIVGEDYDSCRWKFAEYLGNEEDNKQYRFLDDPTISPIIPGKGFWLLISHKSTTLRTGSTAAITLYTNRPHIIELKKGWNIIGNPFNFPVSLSQIIWKGDGLVEVRSYHDAWNQNLYDHVTEILPWEGYAINIQEQDTLLIYPSRELVPDSAKTIMFQPSMDWAVQLIAKCGEAMDADNWIGVSSSSQAKYDRMDISEPPPIGQFVSIAFPHWDWQQRSANYSTDFRPQFYDGDYWDFQVTSNIPDSVVTMHFGNIDKLPSQFKLYLIDKDLKSVQEITQQAKYSFITGTESTIRNFRAIIGTETFFDQSNLGIKRLPLSYKLYDIFPNPFNSNASIYFALPEDNEVTIEIINVLGQRVKTLLNSENKKAGYHLMIWDAKSDDTELVATGLYFCLMKCKNYFIIKKMVFLQ